MMMKSIFLAVFCVGWLVCGAQGNALSGKRYAPLMRKAMEKSVKRYNDGSYKGQLSGGRHSGLGGCVWADGSWYWGRWKDGSMDGKAIYIAPEGKTLPDCPDGVYYVGDWSSDKMSGTGTCYDKYGELIYHGRFSDGKPLDAYPSAGYLGYRLECKRYAGGDMFFGETYHGTRHGYGLYLRRDGGVWYGAWKQGTREGYGIFLPYDGEFWAGRWIGNVYEKWKNPEAWRKAPSVDDVFTKRALASVSPVQGASSGFAETAAPKPSSVAEAAPSRISASAQERVPASETSSEPVVSSAPAETSAQKSSSVAEAAPSRTSVSAQEPAPAPELPSSPILSFVPRHTSAPDSVPASKGGETDGVVRETVGGVSFEMVRVKGGTFTMGATDDRADEDEEPAHQVTLSDYYIGKFEVTQGLWEKVMGTTVRELEGKSAHGYGLVGEGADYPMYYVNWEDAREFCGKLSRMTGKKYALPTEAQWEYAARGGNKEEGAKFGGILTDSEAWYEDNSGGATHAVGTKQPNALGICDMFGNVWEWCGDWYGNYRGKAYTDPQGPGSGDSRVIRGGGWDSGEAYCRASSRNFNGPESGKYAIGFRVVLLP